MIIDVKKYLFVGVQKDLEQFFNRAQEQGYIEFIAKKGRKIADFPKPLQEILSAIKTLRRSPKEKPSEFTYNTEQDGAIRLAINSSVRSSLKAKTN